MRNLDQTGLIDLCEMIVVWINLLSLHRLLEDFERLHLDCVHDLLHMCVRSVLRIPDCLLLPIVDVMICCRIRFGIRSCRKV